MASWSFTYLFRRMPYLKHSIAVNHHHAAAASAGGGRGGRGGRGGAMVRIGSMSLESYGTYIRDLHTEVQAHAQQHRDGCVLSLLEVDLYHIAPELEADLKRIAIDLLPV